MLRNRHNRTQSYNKRELRFPIEGPVTHTIFFFCRDDIQAPLSLTRSYRPIYRIEVYASVLNTSVTPESKRLINHNVEELSRYSNGGGGWVGGLVWRWWGVVVMWQWSGKGSKPRRAASYD